MEKKTNNSGLVIGLLVCVAVIAFGFVWIYLSSQGLIPDIGFGWTVNPVVWFVGLVVAGIVLYVLYPKKKK